MLFKRVHRKDARGRLQVAGIEIKTLPTNGRKHFSVKLIRAGMDEGWLSINAEKTRLTIHSENIGDLVFRLESVPYDDGRPKRYCTICGETVASEPITSPKAGEAAREHVRTMHPEFIPEAGNPGYKVVTYYDCVQLTHLEESDG